MLPIWLVPTPDSPCTDWRWWMRRRAHSCTIHLFIGVLEQEVGCICNARAWELHWSRELPMHGALAHVDRCAHRSHWRKRAPRSCLLFIRVCWQDVTQYHGHDTHQARKASCLCSSQSKPLRHAEQVCYQLIVCRHHTHHVPRSEIAWQSKALHTLLHERVLHVVIVCSSSLMIVEQPLKSS